jgi:hypothetical protein
VVQRTQEAGVVRGRVVWSGPLPAARADQEERFVTIDSKKVAVVARPILRVGPASGGVADVAAWLEGPPADGSGAEPVSLLEDRGQFRPHLQIARRGTQIQLRTSDDKAQFQAAGAATFGASIIRGQMKAFPLSRAGLVEIRSEVYPWMEPAWIHVVEHSHASVTSPDGRFQMPGLTPGDYKLVLWHEGWRGATSQASSARLPMRLEVPLSLKTGEGATVEWTLTEKE